MMTSSDRTKAQLDEEIDDALASSGGGLAGYMPSIPMERPPRVGRARRRPARPAKTTKARKASPRKRTKAKPRPAKKRTRAKASSRKAKPRSTKRSTTMRRSKRKSRAKKPRRASKAKGHLRAATSAHAARAPAPTPARARDPLEVVLEAIAKAPHGARFGGKVFIYPIWRSVGREIGMTLPEFKGWLIRQNRDRMLDLARADLVGAMDPDLVRNSEINDLGSSFHFIIDRNWRGH